MDRQQKVQMADADADWLQQLLLAGKRLNLGLALFTLLLGFGTGFAQMLYVYLYGSVPAGRLGLAAGIGAILLVGLAALVVRGAAHYPLLIWLPALLSLPLAIAVLVAVCPGCSWAQRQVGQGELAVTVQSGQFSAMAEVSALGDEGLWIADTPNSRLVLLNRQTDLPLLALPVGRHPIGVAVGPDSVWTANFDDGTVTRVSRTDYADQSTIEIGGRPLLLAVGANAVWVTDRDRGVVSRINRHTFELEETIPVGRGPAGIAAAPGGIWVAVAGDHQVVRIDPETGRVAEVLAVDGAPWNLALAGESLWVVFPDAGRARRYDLPALAVAADVVVEGRPTGLAIDERFVWVALSEASGVARIRRTDDTLAGEPIATGASARTVTSDRLGGVWVMVEGDAAISHIQPMPAAGRPAMGWFDAWLFVTLAAVPALTRAATLILLPGLLAMLLALGTFFWLEKRYPERLFTRWLVVFALALLPLLLDRYVDTFMAAAGLIARLIALVLVLRLAIDQSALDETAAADGDIATAWPGR